MIFSYFKIALFFGSVAHTFWPQWNYSSTCLSRFFRGLSSVSLDFRITTGWNREWIFFVNSAKFTSSFLSSVPFSTYNLTVLMSCCHLAWAVDNHEVFCLVVVFKSSDVPCCDMSYSRAVTKYYSAPSAATFGFRSCLQALRTIAKQYFLNNHGWIIATGTTHAHLLFLQFLLSPCPSYNDTAQRSSSVSTDFHLCYTLCVLKIILYLKFS